MNKYMSFENPNLRPSPQDAWEVVNLTNEDLHHAKLPEEFILASADPNNQTHVDRQRRLLETNPDQYRILHDNGVLGAVKLDNWYASAQRPYASRLERLVLRKRDLLDEHRLPGNPLGIFALLVIEDEEHDPSVIAETLLNDILEGTEEHEIRMGIHKDDRLKDLLIDHYKFEPTGKHGKILGSPVTQELHIRKPRR